MSGKLFALLVTGDMIELDALDIESDSKWDPVGAFYRIRTDVEFFKDPPPFLDALDGAIIPFHAVAKLWVEGADDDY